MWYRCVIWLVSSASSLILNLLKPYPAGRVFACEVVVAIVAVAVAVAVAVDFLAAYCVVVAAVLAS